MSTIHSILSFAVFGEVLCAVLGIIFAAQLAAKCTGGRIQCFNALAILLLFVGIAGMIWKLDVTHLAESLNRVFHF